jgi:excisionase family DNA binding protein
MDPLLTIDDVAHILGVPPSVVKLYVRRGEIGCVRISRMNVRFLLEHVEEFIAARSKNPSKEGRVVRDSDVNPNVKVMIRAYDRVGTDKNEKTKTPKVKNVDSILRALRGR